MKFPLWLVFTFCSFSLYAQQITLHGTVKDRASGESLIGASVINRLKNQGTVTNNFGFYSLTVSKDSIRIDVSYVGYKKVSVKLLAVRDTTIDFELDDESVLHEVVVVGSSDDKIQERTQMGTIDVPLEQIKKLPALLGEVDVLKVLQLLPGVQAGAEGSSGLYVRGGSSDQNLTLLDGVPVYNASHLFGFFSVFNSDAINKVELVKGGFPARYGGRLSSVIDINMKEGNAKKFKGEGSVGIVASRLTLEGPIVKGRTSFIVSARRTYVDLLASPFIKHNSKGQNQVGYYFYDLNAKINHRINAQNRIYLSAYSGDDKAFAITKKSLQQISDKQQHQHLMWGNITTALRWNSVLSNKLFSNVTATYSRYRFEVSADSETRYYSDTTSNKYYHTAYKSGIRDYAVKVDFDYLPAPDHYVKFGAQAIQHRFSPGALTYADTEKKDTTLGADIIQSREYAVYVEDDFLISSKVKVNAGIHLSGLSVNSKFYSSLQPRLSARYLLSPVMSLKASYAQMTQFIHLLSNAGIGLPTDLWVPATDKVGPEHSELTSLGTAYNFQSNYEISIEGYYKKMNGLIEYKDGANYLNIEDDWQNKVEIGRGQSYGAEVFIQKKKGKVSGWVGYTLSWATRKFANINEGRTFPYRYDRRHDLKTAIVYQWKANKSFSLNWVYGTGASVTLPQSSYLENNPYGETLQNYNGRNSYRMRAYHRLDLSYTVTKQTKWGERSWSFGLYNAYSRNNPFFIDIVTRNGSKKFVQYSLFPIIPSIAYRFKF